jgi:hypothetical protein
VSECGVCECDRETSIMMSLWPTEGCYAMVRKSVFQMKHCSMNAGGELEVWLVILKFELIAGNGWSQ